MKILRLFLCSILLVFLLAPISVNAVQITFIHTGTGSGSLDGNSFSDADFIIAAIGDTDNQETNPSGFFIDHDFASIEISGIGTLDFTTSTRHFINNSDVVGFSHGGQYGPDLFTGSSDSVFNGWDMLSSIGPIAGVANLQQWSLLPVFTNMGTLTFVSGSTSATFQAVVGAPVPEPTTILLSSLGLAGMGAYLRRRKKK